MKKRKIENLFHFNGIKIKNLKILIKKKKITWNKNDNIQIPLKIGKIKIKKKE
jgi:hypothetical protein